MNTATITRYRQFDIVRIDTRNSATGMTTTYSGFDRTTGRFVANRNGIQTLKRALDANLRHNN